MADWYRVVYRYPVLSSHFCLLLAKAEVSNPELHMSPIDEESARKSWGIVVMVDILCCTVFPERPCPVASGSVRQFRGG